MFGLDPQLVLLLVICLLAACAFEFVNGFHDTANAVATVIYTNTLRPWVAVIWSAFWNFIGVFAGGIGVAMGIVYLLPVESLIDQNIYHGLAMIGALLISAILWNLGTWYYGLPASSSHTLIGSILGVGIAYSLLPGSEGAAVNWGKAGDIGLSLIVSPIMGFTLTVFLMFALKRFVKNKTIFKEPHKRKPPPLWIRIILIFTCTAVSFFHGSNDGQKGVGLMMLILIGIVPVYFALDHTKNPLKLQDSMARVELVINNVDASGLSASDTESLNKVKAELAELRTIFADVKKVDDLPDRSRFMIRKDILLITKGTDKLLKSGDVRMSEKERVSLAAAVKEMRSFTDYAPNWVIWLISISLASGTMIGWKRIVKTIGEKIGKEHLTYAQGASAEFMAASVIGISTLVSLPVSTTHILSSGIAGSMVANRGIKNLNPGTVRNIALAWILTLPVTVFLSGALFLLFRWMI